MEMILVIATLIILILNNLKLSSLDDKVKVF